MVFYDGSTSSLCEVRDTLQEFALWSGMEVNSDKTKLYVAGIKDQDLQASLNCGFKEGKLPVRYLGLPLMCRRLRAAEYEPLIERIAGKFRSWSVKSLSYAGRRQLISTVIAGTVVFWISAFIIPKCCLRRIESLCAHFLWSGDPDKKRGAKLAWSKVCLPRMEGGLGLRSFIQWNKALCLRLLWTLLQDTDSIWVAWHRCHHMRGKSLWQLKESRTHSWTWRVILRLRGLARRFIGCDIGPEYLFLA